MSSQISFLPMLEEAEHPDYLLNGKLGGMNDCGVYIENVLSFREGKLTGPYVDVQLCAVGDFILFDFGYITRTYGCGHPLCDDSHKCHRNNSPATLADAIFDVFQHSVLGYDRNIHEIKEKNELKKLCRKACDRIAKEVA